MTLLGTQLLLQRLLRRPTSSGGGGGALTANSVDSSHIVNRSIVAEDIALQAITKFEILDGTITGTQIGSSTIEATNIAPGTITATELASSLLDRIKVLEQTALLRSFDTLVSPVSSFSIPVDLAESERIVIDINILVGGSGGTSIFLKYNTSAATNIGWDQYNGIVIYGDTPTEATLNGVGGVGNNGLVSVTPIPGQTVVVKFELFRSFDINTPSQKYYMNLVATSYFNNLSGGLLKIDSQGGVSAGIITGITLSTGAGTTLKASYSMIKDKRRTALDGALL